MKKTAVSLALLFGLSNACAAQEASASLTCGYIARELDKIEQKYKEVIGSESNNVKIQVLIPKNSNDTGQIVIITDKATGKICITPDPTPITPN